MDQDHAGRDSGSTPAARPADGRTTRRGRRMSVLVLVAVLVAMSGVAAVALLRDDGARDTAMAYLEALSRGDGTTAAGLDERGRRDVVAGASLPGSMDLAGDAGLAMASERLSAPAVHDVERHGSTDPAAPATFAVDVSYTLAGRTHRAALELERVREGGRADEWQVLTPLLTDVRIAGAVDGALGIVTDPADDQWAETARLLYPGVYDLTVPTAGFTPTSTPLVVAPDGLNRTVDVPAPTLSPTPELVVAVQAELDARLAACLTVPAPAESCGRYRVLSFSPSPLITSLEPGTFLASGNATIEWSRGPITIDVTFSGTFEYRDGVVTDMNVSVDD